ncbi:MAG: hypothetical protein ABGY75_06030 [Gemmataceae bacterium]
MMPENARRGHVMDELSKSGNRKYLTHLKGWFNCTEDRYKGGISENGEPRLVEWRDSALALAVVLSGQKPADYGFTVLPTNVSDPYWSDQYLFRSDKDKSADEKREAAFKKWAEWEKANPLPAPKGKK